MLFLFCLNAVRFRVQSVLFSDEICLYWCMLHDSPEYFYMYNVSFIFYISRTHCERRLILQFCEF